MFDLKIILPKNFKDLEEFELFSSLCEINFQKLKSLQQLISVRYSWDNVFGDLNNEGEGMVMELGKEFEEMLKMNTKLEKEEYYQKKEKQENIKIEFDEDYDTYIAKNIQNLSKKKKIIFPPFFLLFKF